MCMDKDDKGKDGVKIQKEVGFLDKLSHVAAGMGLINEETAAPPADSPTGSLPKRSARLKIPVR